MTDLRITPIGTCRIHTPLKRGSQHYPISLELGRNYGFVHTAAEALQLIRFLHGEQDIPAEIAPLIIGSGDVAAYSSQEWTPADLHIVEISSAKKLMCGDHAVQVNYVYRHFADFFANRDRAKKFWSLVRAGDRRDFQEFIREEPTYRLLSMADRELLRSINLEQQSFKAIKAEMTEVVERFGRDSLMFVTHVNAKTPDDELIASRDRLIRWVKLAAEQLGVKAFDPTAAMNEVGQDLALESGGLDLTHYTTVFSNRIYEELHRFHIGDLVDSAADSPFGGGEDQSAATAAQLEAMLHVGDFFATSKQIHAAVTQSPDALPLVELRGIVRSRIGDFAGAAEDLGRRDHRALSHPMRIALLSALTALHRYEEALDVATGLINDEFQDAELFDAASEAAERLGKFDLAIAHAKRSYRLKHSDLSVALRALRLLTDHAPAEHTSQWRQEVLENLGSSASGAFELCQWAIEHSDEDLFAAAIKIVDDKSAVLDLVEEAFGAALYSAVAESVSVLVGIGRLTPPLAKRRAALIEQILERSSEMFQNGRASSAYRSANALAAIADMPQSQLRTGRLAALAERQIRRWILDVRSKINEAKDGDPEEVIRIGESAGELVKADAPIAVAVARALDETDRTQDALKLLKSVEGEVASDPLFRRWTGRIAVRGEEYQLALEMYGSLSADPSVPEEIRTEAARLLSALRMGSIRQLRELIMADQFEKALVLAGSINRRTGEIERVQRELARMYRRLRALALDVESNEADSEDTERYLRLIAQIRPDDQSMLRRLALELMKQFRFAEAAEVWSRIRKLAPDSESAANALNRCETLVRRSSSSTLLATA